MKMNKQINKLINKLINIMIDERIYEELMSGAADLFEHGVVTPLFKLVPAQSDGLQLLLAAHHLLSPPSRLHLVLIIVVRCG